jgi:hypothetical protein
MNIILSTNDNPTYFGFLPVACDYYKELGHTVHVAYVSKNTNLKVNCDSMVRLDPVDGYDLGVQAKLARSYLATQLNSEELYTLMDIDQVLIRVQDIEKVIEEFKQKYITTSDILGIGSNGYVNTPDAGKWPMYFSTANPAGWQKLLGSKVSDTFQDLLERYSNVEDPIDGKEQTTNSFPNFSDESLHRYCSKKNNVRVAMCNSFSPDEGRLWNRIDRDARYFAPGNPNFGMDFWCQDSLTDAQKEQLQTGYFLDCFPARPYEKHHGVIDSIIKESLIYNGIYDKVENENSNINISK